MSVRIDENGAKTKKLWLKQGSRGFFCKETELPGARSEETRGLNIIKPKL